MGGRLALDLSLDDLAAGLRHVGVESRPARPDDLRFAFETLRAAMRDAVESTYGPWDDARQWQLFAPSFDLATHRILYVDGDRAGVLAVEIHVHCVTLARLFLLPERQRRGVGAGVVRAVLELARARGLPVELTVLRSNPDALRFYERLGFQAVAETDTHFHLEATP